MVTRCGICGKITAVTWPEFYVYKIGDCYYCSANCMAVADVKQRMEKSGFVKEDSEMRGKITLEQKKKAVEIALGGGDPRDYLKACGSKNPDAHWYYIKSKLKDTDPGTYYALVGPVGELLKKIDDMPISENGLTVTPGGKIMVEINEETVENQVAEVEVTMDENGMKTDEKITLTNPFIPDGFRVMEVEGKHGRYRKVFGVDETAYMDAAIEGSSITLEPKDWQEVAREIMDAMKVLEI